MVGKEPIKLRPAEGEWPNRQNRNLATPFNFCMRAPGKKNETGKDDVSHSGSPRVTFFF